MHLHSFNYSDLLVFVQSERHFPTGAAAASHLDRAPLSPPVCLRHQDQLLSGARRTLMTAATAAASQSTSIKVTLALQYPPRWLAGWSYLEPITECRVRDVAVERHDGICSSLEIPTSNRHRNENKYICRFFKRNTMQTTLYVCMYQLSWVLML